MSGDIKHNVDTNSADFKQGVDAGLNSAAHSNNWQAGNELGQELKNEVPNKEPASVALFKEPSPPLFLDNSSEGKKGNAQDEKDETEEQLRFRIPGVTKGISRHVALATRRAAMEDVEIGHVVQLRSGGPKMTVHSLVSDTDVICQWFESSEVHEGCFPKEALKKVEQIEVGGSRREDGVFMMN